MRMEKRVAENNSSRLLCVGKIIGAHGIRGEVKIHSYTEDPSMLEEYSPIMDKLGKRVFKLKIRSANNDILIASIGDVPSRNEAELLRGVELYIPRDALPAIEEEDTFYLEDLKGLKVVHEKDRTEFGRVKDIYNYGASDIVAIVTKESKEELFAFSSEVFPDINIAKGYVVIRIPEVDGIAEDDQDLST